MRTIRRFLVLLILGLGALLGGCSKSSELQKQPPLVLDDARLLSSALRAWLASSWRLPGYPLIVQSAAALPRSIEVASEADRLFEKAAERCTDRERCKSHGVYILLSREPRLLQLRVGSDIAMLARARGVTAGSTMVALQQEVLSGTLAPETALRQLVDRVAHELPEKVALPWYQRAFLANLQSTVYFELDQLGSPTESLYSKWLVRGLISLITWFGQVRGLWILALLSAALLAWLLKKLADALIKFVARGRAAAVAPYLFILAALALDALFAGTSAIAAILTSGATLEDRLALHYWEIPHLSRFAFSADAWAETTTIWFAIVLWLARSLAGAVKLIDLFFMGNMPDELQRSAYEAQTRGNKHVKFFYEMAGTGGTFSSEEDFRRSPFTYIALNLTIDSIKRGFTWGLLAWFLLPKVLSIMLLLLWLTAVCLELPSKLYQLSKMRKLGVPPAKSKAISPGTIKK